jgi:hypothetical protein
MYVAVPETGGHNLPFAVDNGRVGRDFDDSAWSNSKDAAITYKDCAIFDWPFSR